MRNSDAASSSNTQDDYLRFEFGENWRQFLALLNEDRIAAAESSLRNMFEVPLEGRRFLDIGSGSGLFSLAARRLGAEVTSFDFDPKSVACTRELKHRYFSGDRCWSITQASVLDEGYIGSLGSFDFVYSWGVLHHTGAMWQGLDSACRTVAPGGRLFIALYNDQGQRSVWWRRTKRAYNRLPRLLKPVVALAFCAALETTAAAWAICRFKPTQYLARLTSYHNVRGMSPWHDAVDWIGGYPFEVATPDAVLDFCRLRSLVLIRLKTCGGKLGCNEFVFERPEL